MNGAWIGSLGGAFVTFMFLKGHAKRLSWSSLMRRGARDLMTTFYNLFSKWSADTFFSTDLIAFVGFSVLPEAVHLGSVAHLVLMATALWFRQSYWSGSCYSPKAAEALLGEVITHSLRVSKVRGLCSDNPVHSIRSYQPCGACSTVYARVHTATEWHIREAAGQLQ